jgi:hypothetical protein
MALFRSGIRMSRPGRGERVLEPAGRRFLRMNPAVFPALFATALPKCPFCLLAYAGALSTFGLDPALYRAWVLPVTLILLVAALATLLIRAPSRHGVGPFIMGLGAAVVILEGKFDQDQVALVYLGMSLLLSASIWNWWPKRKKSSRCCDRGSSETCR